MAEEKTALATPESFEALLEKSKTILEKLNDNELPLDTGVKLYKEGMQALSEATRMLENAKLEFETIESSLNDAPDA